MTDQTLGVACLCAAWCKTCEGYRVVFTAVASRHPAAKFVWIDVEDHSDALGEGIDVDDFPTLALWHGGELCFFGPALPHAVTLERLVAAATQGSLQPLAQSQVPPAFMQALRALHTALPGVG